MKAVYIKEFGDAENLEISDVEKPSISKPNHVLINVKAAGLNRADIIQRKGLYPAPKGFPERILGLEFAGVVSEIGKAVRDFKVGDRVFGITAGGGQAEYILTEETHLARIPDNLNFEEAAAIPEAFITAHDAVWTQGRLSDGETLLIHAVGSGVGLAALQIAKAKGNKVIGTSRTQDKLDECEKFGLDSAINTKEIPEFASEIENSVNVILDLVGASYFEANLKKLDATRAYDPGWIGRRQKSKLLIWEWLSENVFISLARFCERVLQRKKQRQRRILCGKFCL